jgi:hypothetical protein
MQPLKKVSLVYTDSTYSDTGIETLEDITVFNFFGNVMIFEVADGKTFIVRETAKIVNYVIKQQPFISASKKSKK